jgi:hypothetical protein
VIPFLAIDSTHLFLHPAPPTYFVVSYKEQRTRSDGNSLTGLSAEPASIKGAYSEVHSILDIWKKYN